MALSFVGRHRRYRSRELAENDPLSGVANLFDLGLVFMVGLMVMLLSAFRLKDLLDPNAKVTITKEGEKGEVELITKEGKKIRAMKLTGKKGKGRGTKLGTAYRLEDGTMVYVPEVNDDEDN
ncbi:hypothetical protein DBT_1080 [Dissulfuribacter thermophilus]|uniref:DUF2149 domain-containing protein n=1 Tax=Dissulfuribacter thermophilus TaxID=1156395 RepID=A0A1B9F633_9BACT|nr:DUF2149 domain-containing protein [Dissulfuribacter thermophilus]OCC15333.1 hypothetical protein DBT_1080 [Dissulfuribacter thermophilus]